MYIFQRNNTDDAIGRSVEGKRKGLISHLDCQILPHGFYPLIPTILSSMALWTSTVQDGCDFGRLEGEKSITKITGSDVFPFLEVGLYNYRAPIFYATENEWRLAFTYECLEYPMEVMDSWWTAGKVLTGISAVLAGTVCLFLWCTSCISLSIRTWRFCCVTAFLAALFRTGAFFFYMTSICNKQGGNNCQLAFGSKVDILGIMLWTIAGFFIIAHYPDPILRKAFDDEEIRMAEEMEQLRPKQLAVFPVRSNVRQGSNLSSRASSQNSLNASMMA